MARTALIKCRVTPVTKAGLRKIAKQACKSDSDLLRGLIGQAIDGRALDEGARSDMVAVRFVANALLAWKDEAASGEVDLTEVETLATELHVLAARRLGAPL